MSTIPKRHPLVLCLERCASALKHHEEVWEQHGRKKMSKHLYAEMSLATKVLEQYRGEGTFPDYWWAVRNFSFPERQLSDEEITEGFATIRRALKEGLL